MKGSTVIMSVATAACIAIGAVVPYAVAGIQDKSDYSQTSTFDSPNIQIVMDSSSSVVSALDTLVHYDATLQVDGGMRMTSDEVLASVKDFTKQMNDVGFLGEMSADEDWVVTMDSALYYSNETGTSGFFWDCTMGLRNKEVLMDVVVDDSSGKVLSVSMSDTDKSTEKRIKILMKQGKTEGSEGLQALLDNTEEVLSKYLGVGFTEIEDLDSIGISVTNTASTANTDIDKKEADAAVDYDENYLDYLGFGDREQIGNIIAERYLRIDESLAYRISWSNSDALSAYDEMISYWNIVPFAIPS